MQTNTLSKIATMPAGAIEPPAPAHSVLYGRYIQGDEILRVYEGVTVWRKIWSKRSGEVRAEAVLPMMLGGEIPALGENWKADLKAAIAGSKASAWAKLAASRLAARGLSVIA